MPDDGSDELQHTHTLVYSINPLNAELNPICHLLALLGAHHIFHVSGLRVKALYLTAYCVCISITDMPHIFRVNLYQTKRRYIPEDKIKPQVLFILIINQLDAQDFVLQ